MTLKIGDIAPDFDLPTDGTGRVQLSALKGKKVVIYFYPKDDTPGCTQEGCDFRDNFSKFEDQNAVIIGISKDPIKSHDKFKAKYSFPFMLASDAMGNVCETYGVWQEKSMYGKTYMGIVRTTLLVDEQGKIAALWPNLKVEGHVDEVLIAVKALA